jgi:hypothetical protein
MTDSYFWIATCLGSLLAMTVLAVGMGLYLVRRIDGLVRSQEASENRLVQLAYELRRLEHDAAFSAKQKSAVVDDLISVPDLAVAGTPSDAESLAEKHRDVWTLLDAGRSLQEIARETSRPIGQVEVIAGLYRQHQSAQAQGRHDTD